MVQGMGCLQCLRSTFTCAGSAARIVDGDASGVKPVRRRSGRATLRNRPPGSRRTSPSRRPPMITSRVSRSLVPLALVAILVGSLGNPSLARAEGSWTFHAGLGGGVATLNGSDSEGGATGALDLGYRIQPSL